MNAMSSSAYEPDPLPARFRGLPVTKLDPNTRACLYDVIQWHDYSDSKQYACIPIDSETAFLEGEAKRGQCNIVKHGDTSSKNTLKDVRYLCSFAKERHRQRKARQELGHAAAAQLVQRSRKGPAVSESAGLQNATTPDSVQLNIKRVGKNSTGESVSCAACKYSLQLKVFKQRPNSLFVVLKNAKHTNEHGKVAHGNAEKSIVHKKTSPELRKFVMQQHQSGVPPARILQGMNQNTTCFACLLAL
jgi:hypothetical protein